MSSPDGLVIVDKPSGITSHDVVSRLRRLCATRKVGHAGTLDPMATGVLVAGVGRATRLLTYLVGADKTYTATIRIGEGTTTDDAEGETTRIDDATGLTDTQIAEAVAALTGDIQQVPSTVSAIKVDGQRAYARARAGEEVVLAARPVTVHAFDVLARRDVGERVDLEVVVTCSSGTYIRALARDLGEMLCTAGHLTALRRTRVGPYGLDQARTLDALNHEREATGEPVGSLPIAQAAAAAFVVRTVSDDEARDLGYGRALEPSGSPGPVAAIAADGRLLAVLRDRTVRGRECAAPEVVFAPA